MLYFGGLVKRTIQAVERHRLIRKGTIDAVQVAHSKKSQFFQSSQALNSLVLGNSGIGLDLSIQNYSSLSAITAFNGVMALVPPSDAGLSTTPSAWQLQSAGPMVVLTQIPTTSPVVAQVAPSVTTTLISVNATDQKNASTGTNVPLRFFILLLFAGLVIIICIHVRQQVTTTLPLPGRLNEVSVKSADTQVWKTSKVRQNYRKSVLAAQSSKENSESEDDGGNAERHKVDNSAATPTKAPAVEQNLQ